MYPPPAGQELTEEQARELDDTFLSSDPFEYFRSRIAALLSWQELAPVGNDPTDRGAGGSARAEFSQYLQRPAVDGPFDVLDVHSQVAADALAVRHHAAESLLRFACARLAPEPRRAPCLWETAATGPTQIKDVIARLSDPAKAPDASERMFQLFVAPGARTAARGDADLGDAISVFVAWLNYARNLLLPAQIDPQAANNKIKHGLAVRSRSDMRVTFSTRGPDEDGSVPLESLTGEGAIDIFDQPVLEMLAQGPRVAGHRQGLEITQLRLKPAALLAEAFMLAMTHGAMFHVAAAEHFSGRVDLSDHLGPPGFPGFPVGGPRPQDIDANSPLGMRFPLTEPPGGGPVGRVAGIGFRSHFQTLQIDYGNRRTGRVID